MIQKFHIWVFTQRKWKQDLRDICMPMVIGFATWNKVHGALIAQVTQDSKKQATG